MPESFPGTLIQYKNMKHITRFILAIAAMGILAACADKEEPPPVRATTGKTYVKPAR